MRIWILLLLGLLSATTAEAARHVTATRSAPAPRRPAGLEAEALVAAASNRWADAAELAGRSNDRVLEKLIEWMNCSRPGTDAGWDRITNFLKANPDWPGQGALKKRAEDALPPNLDSETTIAWFSSFAPVGPEGASAYAEALRSAGRDADAARVARNFWVNGNFTTEQAQVYSTRFTGLLTRRDYLDRADRLIWEKSYLDARTVGASLGGGEQALVNARIALLMGGPSAGAAENGVPASFRDDPGLIYAEIKYDLAEQRNAEAAELMEDAPAPGIHGDAWSAARLTLARRFIEVRDYRDAYRVAAADKSTDPSQIAEAQFLAGWIALRFLDNAQQAARHFNYMYTHVTTPISQARAAYWLSRAETALGQTDLATQHMQAAAQHPIAFYGQIAAETLGVPMQFPPDARPSPVEAAEFERSELVRAARLFHLGGDQSHVGTFLNRIAELRKDAVSQSEVVHLAHDLDVTSVAVQLAKHAMQNNLGILAGGYPYIHVEGNAPEPALVNGVIRQESLFNTSIVSPAGAIGLMQLMPATAASVARKAGIGSSNMALSQNPSLNVRLGSEYLQQMIDNFGGSYILAIASYNAGPGHIHNWLSEIGDPRHGMDPMDWIELIPLNETRNYVQRVLENTQIYRARMAGGSSPIRIIEDMNR